jgi:hypothetical protein
LPATSSSKLFASELGVDDAVTCPDPDIVSPNATSTLARFFPVPIPTPGVVGIPPLLKLLRALREKSTTLSLGMVSSGFPPEAEASADMREERLRSLASIPRWEMRKVRREGVSTGPEEVSLKSSEEELMVMGEITWQRSKVSFDEADESEITSESPPIRRDSIVGKRGEGGWPSVNGFEGARPIDTCGGKLNPPASGNVRVPSPVRGEGNQLGEASSSNPGEGLGSAGIDIRRPGRSVAVDSPESPCRVKDGRRSCSEKLLRRSRMVMIDSLDPDEEGFEDVVDDMDPVRCCGIAPGRIIPGIGACDDNSPLEVDASEDLRWYRYAEETVICSSRVPGLVNTGPLNELLTTAAVAPDAAEIEDLPDAKDEMDDCRSRGGMWTLNN